MYPSLSRAYPSRGKARWKPVFRLPGTGARLGARGGPERAAPAMALATEGDDLRPDCRYDHGMIKSGKIENRSRPAPRRP